MTCISAPGTWRRNGGGNMLDEKALDLGRMIGQSPENQAMRRAEQSLRADSDAVSRLEKIQELARQVDLAISRGELPDEPTTQSYEQAVRELELSPTGQAYV